MKQLKKKNWPGGFVANEEVYFKSRPAVVVRAYKRDVFPDCVPIIYTDRDTIDNNAFVNAPWHRLVRRGKEWGGFKVGDQVEYRGHLAIVVDPAGKRVPSGYVPAIPATLEPVKDAEDLKKKIKIFVADDLNPS